jgi:hypothetical protein
LDVDLPHLRRCGARIVEFGRDLSEVADRLHAETATGPRWTGEHGGDLFTATFTEITAATVNRLEQLARNLDDLGGNLAGIAAELEAADERAESAVGSGGRGE